MFQGVSGNSVYSIPNAELLLSIDLSIVEFPRENLRFVEVLGEGQFGEVISLLLFLDFFKALDNCFGKKMLFLVHLYS